MTRLIPFTFIISLTVVVLVGIIISYQGYQYLPTLPKTATLLYSESFDDKNALSRFRQGTPDLGHTTGTKEKAAWRVEGGRLFAEKAHNAPLWFKEKLPSGDLRISFQAQAHTNEGDLKCEVFGDGQNHQSGYVFINGGWKNTIRAIARQDEHGEDRHDDHRCQKTPAKRCVEPMKDQTWVIERRDGILYWYIDGVFTLKLADNYPIKGLYFGFNNWSAATSFDELRIHQLSP